MTTATDWDVRDAETNDRIDVSAVRAALADGQVDVERLIHENVQLTDQVTRLRQMVAQLKDSHAALRARLSPLDAGWTPRRDPSTITKAEHLTRRQYDAALAAPTVEQLRSPDDEGRPGAFIAAELVAGVDRAPGWPVWLDELHHAERVDAERWTRLHQMLAESEARTGTVEEQTPEPDGWAWAEYQDVPLPEFHPARELAPERLDADAERRRKALAPPAESTHSNEGSSHSNGHDAVTTVVDALLPLIREHTERARTDAVDGLQDTLQREAALRERVERYQRLDVIHMHNQLRMIHAVGEALGIDQDDADACVPGCDEGAGGLEHDLHHLIERDAARGAAIDRVRAMPAEHPSGGHYMVSMRDVLAALDGTESTDG